MKMQIRHTKTLLTGTTVPFKMQCLNTVNMQTNIQKPKFDPKTLEHLPVTDPNCGV